MKKLSNTQNLIICRVALFTTGLANILTTIFFWAFVAYLVILFQSAGNFFQGPAFQTSQNLIIFASLLFVFVFVLVIFLVIFAYFSKGFINAYWKNATKHLIIFIFPLGFKALYVVFQKQYWEIMIENPTPQEIETYNKTAKKPVETPEVSVKQNQGIIQELNDLKKIDAVELKRILLEKFQVKSINNFVQKATNEDYLFIKALIYVCKVMRQSLKQVALNVHWHDNKQFSFAIEAPVNKKTKHSKYKYLIGFIIYDKPNYSFDEILALKSEIKENLKYSNCHTISMFYKKVDKLYINRK